MEPDDIRSLEHHTLKIPYEILNRKFRNVQKVFDKESTLIQTSVTDIRTLVDNKPNISAAQAAGCVDTVICQLEAMKRKCTAALNDEFEASETCKRRVSHVTDMAREVKLDNAKWDRIRVDRMVVDYLLRLGCYKTAVGLVKSSTIKEFTDIDLFLIAEEVERSLRDRQTAPCLTWCLDNKSKLRKLKSPLEQHIREQEFIEKIRSGKRIEAVSYARKHFGVGAPTSESNGFPPRLQSVMALLVFKVDTAVEPYRTLFSEDRWLSLIEMFRTEIFRIYQLSSQSVFSAVLQAGLSALKTSHCYKGEYEARNVNCPVCSNHLNDLAKNLPYAHQAQSRLMCAHSGEALNEHNQPLVLPNGRVYGEQALLKIACENNGKVVCPKTKEEFDYESLEKVFIM